MGNLNKVEQRKGTKVICIRSFFYGNKLYFEKNHIYNLHKNENFLTCCGYVFIWYDEYYRKGCRFTLKSKKEVNLEPFSDYFITNIEVRKLKLEKIERKLKLEKIKKYKKL